MPPGGWARSRSEDLGTGDATLSLGPAGTGHQGTCPVRVRVACGSSHDSSGGGEILPLT